MLYIIIIIILLISVEQRQQTSASQLSIHTKAPIYHRVTGMPVNPQVLLGEAGNEVEWVWSSWMCFSGDHLVCSQTKHLMCVQQERVIRLPSATPEVLTGVPRVGHVASVPAWELLWKSKDPWNSLCQTLTETNKVPPVKSSFPSRGVLYTIERNGFEVLITREDLRATVLNCLQDHVGKWWVWEWDREEGGSLRSLLTWLWQGGWQAKRANSLRFCYGHPSPLHMPLRVVDGVTDNMRWAGFAMNPTFNSN